MANLMHVRKSGFVTLIATLLAASASTQTLEGGKVKLFIPSNSGPENFQHSYTYDPLI